VTRAPGVVTDAASGVGIDSATLNGELTGLGTAASVDVTFEWGLTTSYGQETTAQTFVGPGTFNAPLAGLLPNTIYHYRAKAVGDGTAYGDDVTFTTSSTPPTVATDPASAVGTTSATLNGDLTDLGTASSVDVSFEWGLTDSYGQETPVQVLSGSDTFSAAISGLAPGTTYHFRAKAVGHGTAYGIDRTFATTTAPPVVTTNNATDVTATTATLHGYLDAMGSDSSVDVTFEWATDAYYTGHGNTYEHETSPWPMTAEGPFSFNLTGLSSDVTYHFRAKAVGHGTAVGEDRTFSIAAQPPNRPPNVEPIDGASCVALPVTLESGPFSDTDAGAFQTAAEWQVRLSTGGYGSPVYASGIDTVNLTSTTLTSAVLGYETEYYWRVRHRDDGGAWSDWSYETSFRTADTPVGIDVTVTPDGTDVNYEQVDADGCTYVRRSNTTPAGHSDPPSWSFRIGPFVDVSTTAGYTGIITVGLPYPAVGGGGEYQNLAIYHWNGTQWQNVTTWIDETNHVIYGEVSSLSWFYIGGQRVWVQEDAPVSPNVFVGIASAFGLVVLAYFVRRKLVCSG